MGYYLLEHPPARPQFYDTRVNPMTGAVGVHTTESVMDNVGPDTGAENVARFIANRTDAAGSYHVIVDADSAVALIPDSYTAFQIKTSGYNSRCWGIAFACREADLHPDSDWTKRAFVNAAREIVDFWLRNGWDPEINARWLSAKEALAMPGLLHHGVAQPVDRTDAFVRNPYRDQLQRLLVRYIFDIIDNPEDDEMPEPKYLLRDADNHIWLTQGIAKVHVPSMDHVNLLLYINSLKPGSIIDNRGPDSSRLLETLGTLPNGRAL